MSEKKRKVAPTTKSRSSKKSASTKVASKTKSRSSKKSASTEAMKCGLCGKTENLTKTFCCGQWICDDEDEYRIFSFARNSCFRNHDRYTLCSYHYNERHKGDWRECQKCREGFETEMYVYYGTNEYNFVKLENPPKFSPTRCAKCKEVINLGEGGYSLRGKEYYCFECAGHDFLQLFSEKKK